MSIKKRKIILDNSGKTEIISQAIELKSNMAIGNGRLLIKSAAVFNFGLKLVGGQGALYTFSIDKFILIIGTFIRNSKMAFQFGAIINNYA